jgi:hypothetical protein
MTVQRTFFAYLFVQSVTYCNRRIFSDGAVDWAGMVIGPTMSLEAGACLGRFLPQELAGDASTNIPSAERRPCISQVDSNLGARWDRGQTRLVRCDLIEFGYWDKSGSRALPRTWRDGKAGEA